MDRPRTLTQHRASLSKNHKAEQKEPFNRILDSINLDAMPSLLNPWTNNRLLNNVIQKVLNKGMRFQPRVSIIEIIQWDNNIQRRNITL